ncbi:histidine kinase [Acidovorax sp. Leaf76]|uniref:response regulator n=1 Tax=unclassified Acidovorax TaxID=2684926 RepID=UPI0006F6011C|nr:MULTISPECIES: response regulator [unclassified Acidovorax]KQO16162.1 histidine kinase [Acidovorax sp. Leaf76]KQO32235.1 histidine kinase [Acidovorax sp. Leaf84]KQS31795.1 histidine kinase [Acidovorax sp. Leaf191]
MEGRVLILAPHGRDAQVIESVLRRDALQCLICSDAATLLSELEAGASTAVLTEEVLAGGLDESLRNYLAQQPAWSDFPFVVLATRQPVRRSARAALSLQELGNLVILERPVNPDTLLSAARSAFRARARQYASRRHLTDIESAKQTVEQLNADLESRIAARTSDLAGANDRLMREIADRERIQSKVVQSQKLEAIGRLTGGIAHDFNNLLHAVSMNLQFIMRLADEKRLADYARRAKESVDRGARLTAQLLSFSRAQSLLPKLHEVNTMVGNLRELIEVSVGSKVQVHMDLCEDEAWALFDGAQLEMALLNMAVNSRDAMPDGGHLTIRTRLVPGNDGVRRVQISVQDTGCGIPEALQSKVFDPFFTTKADGEGTGLGLSQVYGFASQSGGSAEIHSREGEGTTVTLQFAQATPAVQSAPDAAAAPGGAANPARRTEVLVVEDDDAVRRGITEGLRLLNYSVREASDGESGLRELQRRMPDLLMADYLMPGMNGAEFIAAARQLYPEIPVLMATGYADMAEVERLVGVQSVLKKPFDLETLNSAVGSELARWRLRA